MSDHKEKSYHQVLKSTTLIGGSSMCSVALGIIRTKAIALLLGPSGVGLIGIYGTISELARSLAGVGLGTSGVRQIAEAANTSDGRHLARRAVTLRRVALFSALLGSILVVVFSGSISKLTFGDRKHWGPVALLAVAVFFGSISAAQAALVQGLRRIADLAKMNVLGALWGTAFSIPIVYFFGERGIVPFLVCVAITGLATSWWYARKTNIVPVSLTFRQTLSEASGLLKLGFVFMASGFMVLGSAYLIRIIILRKLGIEAAGYYQAAWALGGLYVGFILQAMGADFFPRLTAVIDSKADCNRLVNEQAEVGLLLAGPGVLATLVFAPIVIDVFYSGKFGPAVELLRWISLGMMLRVASWPIAFVIVAKGDRSLFFWSETGAYVVQVVSVWAGLRMFGLAGAGVGLVMMYAVYFLAISTIVRSLSGFRWSSSNLRLAGVFAPLVLGVFVGWYILPRNQFNIFGVGTTLLGSAYSLKSICNLVPLDKIPQPARAIVRFLGLRKPQVPNSAAV